MGHNNTPIIIMLWNSVEPRVLDLEKETWNTYSHSTMGSLI